MYYIINFPKTETQFFILNFHIFLIHIITDNLFNQNRTIKSVYCTDPEFAILLSFVKI